MSDQYKNKTLHNTLQKSEKNGDGFFVISSTAEDLDKDVVSLEALTEVTKNNNKLVTLFDHDPSKPVGYWDRLKVEGKKLVGRLNLAPTNLGKMIGALLDHGTPLGASIGFRGRGSEREQGGFLYSHIEIFETSIVSIPCNREAFQIAKSFGLEKILVDTKSKGIDSTAVSGLHFGEIRNRSAAAIIAAKKQLRKPDYKQHDRNKRKS